MPESESFPSRWREPGKGYQPGDTPSDVAWPETVCLILPPKQSNSQTLTIALIQDRLRSMEYHCVTMRATSVSGFGGQKFSILRPSDAAGLYVSSHRERVFVVTVGGVKVQLDTTEMASNRGTVPVSAFIEYKAGHVMITRPEEVDRGVGLIQTYMSQQHCDGSKDPRCLPFSLYERNEAEGLASRTARNDFVKRYRSYDSEGFGLLDDQARRWTTREYHTRDLLHVGGSCLPIGFHWNVECKRKTAFANGWETWAVSAGGYTNVHPDAKIRGGSGSVCVKKLGLEGEQRRLLIPLAKRSARGRRRK